MAFGIENNHLVIKSKNKQLKILEVCEGRDLPFYIYDLDGIEERFNYFKKGLSKSENSLRIHYAMKANSHPEILSKLKSLGAHVDVVSLGEVNLALKNGFEPKDIIFSGVGKSKHEITESLKLGVFQINVESLPELERIGEIAKAMKVVAPIGIRFNPDVNPETHPYITTGFRENKFGLDFSETTKIEKIKNNYSDVLNLQGMSIHIGSQIKDTQSFLDAIDKTMSVFKTLQKNSAWNLQSLDIGGGLGINYDQLDADTDLALIDKYCTEVVDKFKNLKTQIICEPGRLIVGRFGALIGKIEYIKTNNYKKFVILNTGMHHLMRPCLYKAVHTIVPVLDNNKKPTLYDIVGPICESSDVLGHDRLMSELQQEEWLAVMDAGAYGAVMASNYNQHPAIEELVISDGSVKGSRS